MGPCHPLAAARPGGAGGEALACVLIARRYWLPSETRDPTVMHLLLALLLQFLTDPAGELMVLGVGGHGVVYMASLLGAQVAVKVRN